MLHPAIQATLIGLDVTLDQELIRYRRQRTLRRHEPSPRVHQTPALSSSAASPNFSNLSTASAAVPSAALGSASLYYSADKSAAADGAIASTLPSPEPHASSVDGYLESSEELLRSLVDDPHASAQAPNEDDEPEEPGLIATLLTPLGVGSMLLLLLSSATLGYVLLNPSLFGLPSIASLWRGDDPSEVTAIPTSDRPQPNLAAEEFIELDLDTLSTLPRPGSSPIVNRADAAPPLNADAPPDANTPSIVTYLRPTFPVEDAAPPQPVSEPSVAASPSPPPSDEPPVEPAADYQPPQSSPTSSPAADYQPPQSSPTSSPASSSAAASQPSAAAVSTVPADTTDTYYYVVTDYSGDASLNDAREAVGDAYVRNFPDAGAQVQFGAFTDSAGAESLLNELQRQGISAEIYQP